MSSFYKCTVLMTQLFLCACIYADVNYMAFNKGQETCDYMQPADVKYNFVPYSEAFVRSNSLIAVTTPKKKVVPSACFTGLARVPVKAGMIYSLNLTAMGHEQLYVTINGLFFNGDNYVKSSIIFRNIFLLNVNGMTSFKKDFAVPPGVDNMILNTRWTYRKAGKKLSPGVAFVIKELAITEKFAIKTPPSGVCNKNFLTQDNFKHYPLGAFNDIHKGKGDNAAHWPDVEADIVMLDGEKCLRIERKLESYIYPFFTSQAFPFNPHNYFIKASMTVCGKGKVRLGLWWQRQEFSTDYYHTDKEYVLSDEWRTITTTRACLSPLVTNANLSFTSKGGTRSVIYVKDVRIEFINPRDSN